MMYAFLLLAFGLISAYEIGSGLLELALPVFCTCGGDERPPRWNLMFQKQNFTIHQKSHSLFLQLLLPPPRMKLLFSLRSNLRVWELQTIRPNLI